MNRHTLTRILPVLTGFALVNALYTVHVYRLSYVRRILSFVFTHTIVWLGCISEINRVGVGGEAGSAKAAEPGTTRRVVPSRSTPARPAYPLTRSVRRPELIQEYTLG
jgi:hypothetical protein